MGLPLLLSKTAFVLKNFGGRALLLVKAHAPQIFIGAGIIGFGGTVAATVHATNQTHDILDEREEEMKLCDDMIRTNEDYTREAYEEDLKKIRKGTRKKLIRAWVPVGTLGTGSVISVLGGYRILNGRYVATAAAYKTLEAGFERYRGNVISKFGKDVDLEMRRLKAEELDEIRRKQEEEDRTEGTRKRRKPKKTAWEQMGQMLIFDDHSERWQRYWTGKMALEYLRVKNNQLADLLWARGCLFGNDINDMLGLPRTPEGQVVGILYERGVTPIKNLDILGLDDMTPDQIREIECCTRNEDIRIPLYPHLDGIVFDLMGKEKGTEDLGAENLSK